MNINSWFCNTIVDMLDDIEEKVDFVLSNLHWGTRWDFYKNLNREIFLNILANADLLIGNSSCGILEAPSFKIPVINIGNRQRGRMQASNIINVKADKTEILKKIKFAFSSIKYKKSLKKCKNPYGDGKSSKRIIKILKKIKLGKNLLDKKITY